MTRPCGSCAQPTEGGFLFHSGGHIPICEDCYTTPHLLVRLIRDWQRIVRAITPNLRAA